MLWIFPYKTIGSQNIYKHLDHDQRFPVLLMYPHLAPKVKFQEHQKVLSVQQVAGHWVVLPHHNTQNQDHALAQQGSLVRHVYQRLNVCHEVRCITLQFFGILIPCITGWNYCIVFCSACQLIKTCLIHRKWYMHSVSNTCFAVLIIARMSFIHWAFSLLWHGGKWLIHLFLSQNFTFIRVPV